MDRFRVKTPKSIIFEVTLEMPLEKWIEMRDQIAEVEAPHYSPLGQMVSNITSMIIKAQKEFYPDEPK